MNDTCTCGEETMRMILNSQTGLFIGDEPLLQVCVSEINWYHVRAAEVKAFCPFPEAHTAMEKIVEGADIDIVTMCCGQERKCRRDSQLLISLKHIRNIKRRINHPVVLSPDDLGRLMIQVSFDCVLEFADYDQASS